MTYKNSKISFLSFNGVSLIPGNKSVLFEKIFISNLSIPQGYLISMKGFTSI